MGTMQKNNNYTAVNQTVQMEIEGVRRNDKFLGVTSKFPLFSHVTIQVYRCVYSSIYRCVIGGLSKYINLEIYAQKPCKKETPFKIINRSCIKC